MEREQANDHITEGERAYQEWRDALLSDPEMRAIYEEEGAKKEMWLQLVEARQASGLTQKQVADRLGVSQAQVARIEKRGYDSYTLRTLQRYLAALGEDYKLQVAVKRVLPSRSVAAEAVASHP